MFPQRCYVAHYIHYVARKVAIVSYQNSEAPWFARNQPDNQGFLAPSYHVSRDVQGPATRVCIDDYIWLVSELRTPWERFPPALDACVRVASVQQEAQDNEHKLQLKFLADSESRWFPLHDAFPTLRTLESIDSNGHCHPLLSRHDLSVGIALQSMRQLVDATPLLRLAQIIDQQGYDFISYRLSDGTRAATTLANLLVSQGASVFWDRWSLPRRLAERREFVRDAALDNYIATHVEASNLVWGILSPTYDAPCCYARRESSRAKELGKFVGVLP